LGPVVERDSRLVDDPQVGFVDQPRRVERLPLARPELAAGRAVEFVVNQLEQPVDPRALPVTDREERVRKPIRRMRACRTCALRGEAAFPARISMAGGLSGKQRTGISLSAIRDPKHDPAAGSAAPRE
jgi:hypothetical protein